MNAHPYSMAYLMDSEVVTSKNDISIYIDSIHFDQSILSDSTQVVEKNKWFLPLVIYNSWGIEKSSIKGQSMFYEEIPSFLAHAFKAESQRSARYVIEDNNKADYTLDFTIEEIETKGTYIREGGFLYLYFLFFYSHYNEAEPTTSKLSIAYRLKKNNRIVLSNRCYSETVTSQILRKKRKTELKQKDYAASKVEATANNFKTLMEWFVKDIDNYLTRVHQEA